MSISINTVLSLVGAILVLTACIGGGFEIKGAKIPKVNGWGRIGSLVIGSLCLLAVIGMEDTSADAAPAASSEPARVGRLYDEPEAGAEDDKEAAGDVEEEDLPLLPPPPDKPPPPPT